MIKEKNLASLRKTTYICRKKQNDDDEQSIHSNRKDPRRTVLR